MIIKEHNGAICCICPLNSEILASCSEDKFIKLFNIEGNKYTILQTLNYHKDTVYKIINFDNNNLISCSKDSSIIFYVKNKNYEFKKSYSISIDGSCSSVIKTKENEICFSEKNCDKITFYDIREKKLKATISNISKRNYTDEWLIILNKNILAVPGKNQITIINIDKYKQVKIIKVPDSSWILGSCKINENILFTGERNLSIRQWKIEEDNLILVSKEDNAHNGDINTLVNLGNGHFASGSDGGIIKIW